MHARTITALLATAVLATPLTGSHVPASAHEVTTYAYQGNDVAAIDGDTGDGYVHDKECDGHTVRVRLYMRRHVSTVADENGCKPGGGRFNYGDDAIDSIQVIERQDDGSWTAGKAVAVHHHG